MSNETSIIEQVLVLGMLLALACTLLYGFVKSLNRNAQLRKIKELNKNVSVFIREVPFTKIDNVSGEVKAFTSYSPHYKRPVCGDKGQEIEFVDECIISDFPRKTNYQDREQVNTLLVFWKRKHEAEAKKEYVEHPVVTFHSTAVKKMYWEQVRKTQAEKDTSIF